MRYRTTSKAPVVSTSALKAEVEAYVEKMKAAGAQAVDGAYCVITAKPVADGKVLNPPRTREQRRAARFLAARGKFCGFYPVTG